MIPDPLNRRIETVHNFVPSDEDHNFLGPERDGCRAVADHVKIDQHTFSGDRVAARQEEIDKQGLATSFDDVRTGQFWFESPDDLETGLCVDPFQDPRGLHGHGVTPRYSRGIGGRQDVAEENIRGLGRIVGPVNIETVCSQGLFRFQEPVCHDALVGITWRLRISRSESLRTFLGIRWKIDFEG